MSLQGLTIRRIWAKNARESSVLFFISAFAPSVYLKIKSLLKKPKSTARKIGFVH